MVSVFEGISRVASNNSDLSVAHRADQFSALVSNCAITGRNCIALDLENGISAIVETLARARNSKNSVYVIGNGGSAGIAGHVTIDFVNIAKLRAFTLHDAPLLTCMANDYGYENAFARLLGQMAKPGDVLIAISSSGRSPNICNAAAQVAAIGGVVITLSGFMADNPLRTLGDINVWLPSTDYGLVEIGHQFVLHNVTDRFGANHFE